MTETMANVRDEWLSPHAALNRFNPPEVIEVDTLPSQVAPTRFGFRAGNIGLLVEQNTVSEVLEKLPVYPIPNTPLWLLGVMNVRGNLVPVFDLHQLLQTGASTSKNPTGLMLGKGEDALIILIDGLPQALNLSRRLKQLPPMPKVLKGHIHTAYTKDGSIWLDFDHRGLFRVLSASTLT